MLEQKLSGCGSFCLFLEIIMFRCSINRSNSTGSLFSVASVDSSIPGHSGTETSHEDTGPSLEAYIEAFLITLITLNHKRNLLPIPVLGLLSLSPLANKIGISPQDKALRVSRVDEM